MRVVLLSLAACAALVAAVPEVSHAAFTFHEVVMGKQLHFDVKTVRGGKTRVASQTVPVLVPSQLHDVVPIGDTSAPVTQLVYHSTNAVIVLGGTAFAEPVDDTV